MRNHRLLLLPDGRDVVAADVAAAIGGLTEISQQGRSGAMQRLSGPEHVSNRYCFGT
jgi:hypothetical protein